MKLDYRDVQDSEDEQEIDQIVAKKTGVCPYCKQNETKIIKKTGELLPCKVCCNRRISLYKYGLTLRSFYKMLDEQKGRCAICDQFLIRPHVDHCHDFDHVRGILCGKCNMGLGSFNDNPDALRAAIAYLDKNRSSRKWWAQRYQ